MYTVVVVVAAVLEGRRGLTCWEKALHNVPDVYVQYTASVLIEQTLQYV